MPIRGGGGEEDGDGSRCGGQEKVYSRDDGWPPTSRTGGGAADCAMQTLRRRDGGGGGGSGRGAVPPLPPPKRKTAHYVPPAARRAPLTQPWALPCSSPPPAPARPPAARHNGARAAGGPGTMKWVTRGYERAEGWVGQHPQGPPRLPHPLPTCSSSSIRAARVRFMWPHVAAAVNAVTRGRRATTHVAKWALQGTVRTVPLRLCLEGCAAEDAAAAAAVGFCH